MFTAGFFKELLMELTVVFKKSLTGLKIDKKV